MAPNWSNRPSTGNTNADGTASCTGSADKQAWRNPELIWPTSRPCPDAAWSELIARLAIGSYLVKRQDVILQGPTGAGKTYVACALGNKACQQYRKVLYLSADELFDRITIAERTGDKKRCLDTLVKVELLIIDDWFLTPPTRPQVQQLHTLIDRRHKTASTIYCTQLPPGQWHDRMEEKILADAIVDRITTNAHATVLDCDDSMRKHFTHLE